MGTGSSARDIEMSPSEKNQKCACRSNINHNDSFDSQLIRPAAGNNNEQRRRKERRKNKDENENEDTKNETKQNQTKQHKTEQNRQEPKQNNNIGDEISTGSA